MYFYTPTLPCLCESGDNKKLLFDNTSYILFLILLFIRYNFCSDQFLFKSGRFRDINTEIFNIRDAVPDKCLKTETDNLCQCDVTSFDSWILSRLPDKVVT